MTMEALFTEDCALAAIAAAVVTGRAAAIAAAARLAAPSIPMHCAARSGHC